MRSSFLSYGKEREERKSQAQRLTSIVLPLRRLRQEDRLKSDQFRIDREYQANQDYTQDFVCVCVFKKTNLCNLGGWKTFLTKAANIEHKCR